MSWREGVRFFIVTFALLGACTQARETVASSAPGSSAISAAPEVASREVVQNCKRMDIPANVELNTFLDQENEILEVSFLGGDAVDVTYKIRYQDYRCLTDPDTMRVITHALDTAGVPVPMPSMSDYKDCPHSRHLRGAWYFVRPCSPSLESGVTYELLLTTSCSELPDFDDSYWDLDPKQERKHSHHLSGHHGLNGTVKIVGEDAAVFKTEKGGIIGLTRHEGGDAACARD